MPGEFMAVDQPETVSRREVGPLTRVGDLEINLHVRVS